MDDVDVGDVGVTGEPAAAGETGSRPVAIFSNASATPLAGTGAVGVASGVAGWDMSALPSSELASYSSGGRRSFSISDLRLERRDCQQSCQLRVLQWRPYASSKPEMASLIPSAPSARVPYGSLPDPDTLLSSETFSDSSLFPEYD